MKHPIFNISLEPCNETFFPLLFWYSEYLYDDINQSFYKKNIHDRAFVDTDGNLYKAIDLIDRSTWLRKKLPLQRKYELVVKKLNVLMTFEEVKEKYLYYLSGFENEEAKQDQIEFVRKCNRIADLF